MQLAKLQLIENANSLNIFQPCKTTFSNIFQTETYTLLRYNGIIKNYTLQFHRTIYLNKEKTFTSELVDVKIL